MLIKISLNGFNRIKNELLCNFIINIIYKEFFIYLKLISNINDQIILIISALLSISYTLFETKGWYKYLSSSNHYFAKSLEK